MPLSPEEFSVRFAAVDITPEDIQWAVRIGLVELDGSKLSIFNEVFIDLGTAAARMGLPVSEIPDEHEAAMITVNGIAEHSGRSSRPIAARLGERRRAERARYLSAMIASRTIR